MKTLFKNKSDCHIYPGEFVSTIPKEEIKKKNIKNRKIIPLVNFTEISGLLKIEIALPGIERQDIILETEHNILSVFAVHKKNDSNSGEIETIREFDYDIFERKIPLPKDADISFIHAEYGQGILKMHIPKTKKNEIVLSSKIVVY